ncbi:MAG: tetratricopeptide repeat protein [Limisphaerales bacterium]
MAQKVESLRIGTPVRGVSVFPLALAWFFAMALTAFAGQIEKATFANRAETAFKRAQAQYQSQMDNPRVAWEFARACFDRADWATNNAQRAAIARQGIAACRQSLLFTNSAAGHYYLAMNMGQLARTETLGALKLVREMEHEFLAAADLDPRADLAGPERGLGLLYRDAPGWPLSIGNRTRARKFLETAVMLAPDDPENILNLAESYLKWGNKAAAKKELEALDILWPAAQKSLNGLHWGSSWYDWTHRRELLRKKLAQ